MDGKQYEKLKPGTPVEYRRNNGEVIPGTITQKWTPCGRNAYLLNYFLPAGKKNAIDIHHSFIFLCQP